MKKLTLSLAIALLLGAPAVHADSLEDAIKKLPAPDTKVGLCSGWNDKVNGECTGTDDREKTQGAPSGEQPTEIVVVTKTVESPEPEEEGKVLGASTDQPAAYSLLKKEIEALKARLNATETEKPTPFDSAPLILCTLLIVALLIQNEWRLRKVAQKIAALQADKRRKIIKKS